MEGDFRKSLLIVMKSFTSEEVNFHWGVFLLAALKREAV